MRGQSDDEEVERVETDDEEDMAGGTSCSDKAARRAAKPRSWEEDVDTAVDEDGSPLAEALFLRRCFCASFKSDDDEPLCVTPGRASPLTALPFPFSSFVLTGASSFFSRSALILLRAAAAARSASSLWRSFLASRSRSAAWARERSR